MSKTTLKYNTGRIYNGPQVLMLDVPAMPEELFDDVEIVFQDSSRGIIGKVSLMAIECFYAGQLNANEIGEAVLRDYDAGHYDLI